MSKRLVNFFLFLFVFSTYFYRLISHLPIQQIKENLKNGSVTTDTQPTVTKSSLKLDQLNLKAGDIILKINDEEMTDQILVREKLLLNQGKNVSISILRAGQPQNISITVPSGFQPFGYGNDIHLGDENQIKKSAVEIIFSTLYAPSFEQQFSEIFGLNARLVRFANYFFSILMMAISICFIFSKKIAWYIAFSLVLIGCCFYGFQTFWDTQQFTNFLFNLFCFALLVYTFKLNFGWYKKKAGG